MTRKHFNFIAEMLATYERQYMTEKSFGQVCSAWADELSTQNSAFNRYQFLKACGAIK